MYQVTCPPHLFLHSLTHSLTDDLMNRRTNPHAVFTNSELSLKHVDVYGFDFDCTLVHYTSEVHRLIYELARDRLVEHNQVRLSLSLSLSLSSLLISSGVDLFYVAVPQCHQAAAL